MKTPPTIKRATLLLAGLLTTAAPGLARAASPIAFYNEADPDKGYKVPGKDPVVIASVTLEVSEPSSVLVQFTSHATTEETAGCPCSLRASLRADDGPVRTVRRVNLGAPAVVDTMKYEHDRQGVVGSYVFDASPGQHTYSLIAQQQTGESTTIELYYPNLQAIAFPKR